MVTWLLPAKIHTLLARVHTLLPKIHTWAGLLTFVNLMVFGAAGLGAALEPPGGGAAASMEYRSFTVEPGWTDRQVAERVVELLHLPLATPVQKAAIQHDSANRLVLDFYHANGRHKVAVLAAEGRLRVSVWRASFWKYLSTLHVTTAAFRSGDARMQLWAWYNEFAMWCLLVLMASGTAIWLTTRPRRRSRIRSLHFYVAVCCLPFLAMYGITAVRMAHRTWFGAAAGFMETLNRMHRLPGAWRGYPWVVLPGLVSMGLLAMGVTGLCLWFEKRNERRTGGAMLASGVVLAGGLIVWMRAG
jgi:hypothetical protein